MECRVDVSPESGRTVVRIHGRLGGAAVLELKRACREASGSLILDLTYLMSADDAGIAVLRRLAIDGVPLAGMSPYLRLLLEPEEA